MGCGIGRSQKKLRKLSEKVNLANFFEKKLIELEQKLKKGEIDRESFLREINFIENKIENSVEIKLILSNIIFRLKKIA
ncbi:hypothetical protein DLH72_01825 [Candidatus Gracilibacteria bacterium]|nr:MAG: hypothetical protein DLH72_01825 [Candidatus Gracilibacteria bacterium]